MDKQQPSATRLAIFCAMVSAVVSSLTLVVLTRIWDRFSPNVQQIAIITGGIQSQQSAHEDPFPSRVPKIQNAAGIPPYAYTLEYAGHAPEKAGGFLGLERTPASWLYLLRFANLTVEDLPAADLSVEYSGPMDFLQLTSSVGRLYESADEPKNVPEISVAPPMKRVLAAFKPVGAAKSHPLFIAVYSKTRPDIADIKVTIHSSEGDFVKITPAQYDAIGWQN
jgi:hypothetical protein